MKITHKFLLLGLIPAIAQAIICWQLFSLLGSVEYYAEKEAKQRIIARTLCIGLTQSMEVAMAAGTYATLPSPETAARLQTASEEVDKSLASLRAATMDDPTALAEVDQLLAIGAETRKDYLVQRGIERKQQSEEYSLIGSGKMHEFKTGQTFKKRLMQAAKIFDRQNAQIEAIRIKQKANRRAVEGLVLAELLLGLAVVAVSYLLFRYDFGRRFENLLQIAQDLALDRPTSRTISGGDELSHLSDALITAAEARREAVAQKQILFQMVSHDLRSPLMAAALVIEALLQDNKASFEKTQSRLHSVGRSIQRVVALANDLLTIERLSAGEMEINKSEVDFQKTVAQAIESLQSLAEQKQCQLVNHSPNLIVLVDEDRILQITVNLLANAIKFSPPGAEVEIIAATEGNRLRVQVLDRGPGISDQEIKKLFNPFQQVSASDKTAGFGLGLAIAKMLVELLDGNIGAGSRPEGGTIFWFTVRL